MESRLSTIGKTSRQKSKEKGGYTTIYINTDSYNTLRKLSHASADHVKCPVNIAEVLSENAKTRAWKTFKAYLKFLDVKAQFPNLGIFDIKQTATKERRYFQRVINELISKGWAWRQGNVIKLRAYQAVWRSMGIERITTVTESGKRLTRYKYWKFPTSEFTGERKEYMKLLEQRIRERITKRKLAQMRFALRNKGLKKDTETFSCISAGFLFGYKSPSTGSKLRDKFFSVVDVDKQVYKPKFDKRRGIVAYPSKEVILKPL